MKEEDIEKMWNLFSKKLDGEVLSNEDEIFYNENLVNMKNQMYSYYIAWRDL